VKTGEKTLEIMSKAIWYNDWLLGQISNYLRGDILEVGAGIGNFTSKLARYGKVTAIDYDQNYKNANFGDIEKGKYFFGSKSFDTVVCMNVLEHIKNDRSALKNMYSLLKVNGKLILLVPAFPLAYGQMDKGLGHFRRYTKDTAGKKIKEAGFITVENKYINWLGLIGWFVNARILKKEIIPEGQLKLFNRIAKVFLYFEKFINPPFGLSVLAIGEKK